MPSAEPVASTAPSGRKATQRTSPAWPVSPARTCPEAASHNMAAPGSHNMAAPGSRGAPPTAARVLPSGPKARASTRQPGHGSATRSRPVAVSHTLTSRWPKPASVAPSGANATAPEPGRLSRSSR